MLTKKGMAITSFTQKELPPSPIIRKGGKTLIPTE